LQGHVYTLEAENTNLSKRAEDLSQVQRELQQQGDKVSLRNIEFMDGPHLGSRDAKIEREDVQRMKCLGMAAFVPWILA
jgi:uncharacterized protein (DUF3084 family)